MKPSTVWKQDVYWTYIRRPDRLLNVLCTSNSRGKSREIRTQSEINKSERTPYKLALCLLTYSSRTLETETKSFHAIYISFYPVVFLRHSIRYPYKVNCYELLDCKGFISFGPDIRRSDSPKMVLHICAWKGVFLHYDKPLSEKSLSHSTVMGRI